MQGENIYHIVNIKTGKRWTRTFGTRREAEIKVEERVQAGAWILEEIEIQHERIPY